MKLFSLIMVVLHPFDEPTNYVLDYDMSLADCWLELKEWNQAENPNVTFECVMQKDQ